MKFSQTVRLGAWLIIGLNLLMAFGSIWVFARMTPAIEVISSQNERSLKASETMLAALALSPEAPGGGKALQNSFSRAYETAQKNITEQGESEAIALIAANYIKALNGDALAKQKTVKAVLRLGEINRKAMVAEDLEAMRFGAAGAWGVAFMAAGVFFAGMLFIRVLKRGMIKPLEEMRSVLTARRNGNRLRRCSGYDLPPDIRSLFNDFNEVLDEKSQ